MIKITFRWRRRTVAAGVLFFASMATRLFLEQGPVLATAQAQQRQGRAAVTPDSAVDRPEAAEPGSRTIRLSRPPVREIKNSGSIFSAVAVDPVHNEIVLQDENAKRIMVYDRLANTPPSAAMSEPKRIIGGRNSKVSDNCGVYVDPHNGDIYSITGDVTNNMLIFSHDQKGNVPAEREMKTPHRLYGIAVNEDTHELYLTARWPAAVFVYRKEAEGREAPLRIMEGPHTQLAASTGIALDTKNGVFFVANWGSGSQVEQGKTYSDVPITGEGANRTWEMPNQWYAFWREDRFIPGSGSFTPPFIAVYPLDAKGDTPPVRVIRGDKTQLDWPSQMSLDVERQELYIANIMQNSVLVFRATDSGNAAPIRVVKGAKTEIDHPLGIFFDAKNDEVVVSNWGNDRAVIFPRTANGDVAPIRRIRSAPEGTQSPMLSHMGAINYDTKRDEILVNQ